MIMDKKTTVIIVAIIFIIAALVAGFYELTIDKELEDKNNVEETTKENKKITTTTKKEENLMDGITVNYHASIKISKDDKVIYFDPFKIDVSSNDADYIFITHSHYDHYSEIDIKKVMKDGTKFIITSDLESKIINLGVSKENILVVYPNEEYNIDDLKFETIPAYNINKTYHKKSYNWVGYNLNLNGTKYYVVGDSDVTEELKNVRCDIIFIPVGGTYTMSDSEAANVVNEIKPSYVVPIHYGEVGSITNAENFVNALNADIKGVILK